MGGKRALDIAIVVLALPTLLPILGAIYLSLKATGTKPFFGHERVGKSGKLFKCWKFRTMALDADTRLAQLLATDPAAAQEWETRQKLTNDPRVTRLGRILRVTSFDELPQLWNVIRGEMSLVGPRPVTSEEMRHYGHAAGAYKALRPGLTGSWQVSLRREGDYASRVKLDLDYLRNLTLVYDLKILGRTFGAIVRQTGE